MRYDVAEQLKEGPGSFRGYNVDSNFVVEEDGLGRFRVAGELSLLGSNRGILALGQLNTAIKMECGRCLEPFWQDLELSIEREYTVRRDLNRGTAVESAFEDDSFLIDESFVLDLSEAVRQEIILALPMQPICKDDCLGLCPSCGANLNLAPCSCDETLDEKWAPLQALKIRLQG